MAGIPASLNTSEAAMETPGSVGTKYYGYLVAHQSSRCGRSFIVGRLIVYNVKLYRILSTADLHGRGNVVGVLDTQGLCFPPAPLSPDAGSYTPIFTTFPSVADASALAELLSELPPEHPASMVLTIAAASNTDNARFFITIFLLCPRFGCHRQFMPFCSSHKDICAWFLIWALV